MTDYIWNIGAVSGKWENAASWTPAGGPPSLSTDDNALLEDIAGTAFTDTVSAGASDSANILYFIGDLTTPTLAIDGTLTVNTLTYDFDAVSANVDVNAGGTFKINDGVGDFFAPAETITISGKGAGGHLTLGNLLVGAGVPLTFTFDNNATGKNAGVIEFGTTGATATQTITGVAWGDEFVIDGATFTGDKVSYNAPTTTLKVTNQAGTTTFFTMTGVTAAAGTTFTIVDTDIIQAVCYARGTMLRTPDGELPVEKLRAGKQVITLVDGQEVPKEVTWLGHRRINLAGHPRPETVAPIRIRRGAFAEGVPHRDLIVSPDHAIFVDGRLICARQLVNGSTIRQESDWTAVDYYHVELESHAILLAEGLPAESYIDTGNSGFFENSDAPLVLHPDLTDETDYPTRQAGSCAPFVWDEASVRPIWQRLADRATTIGQPTPQRAVTTEANLRLRGKMRERQNKPIYTDSKLAIFVLPRGAAQIHLLSRAQSPAEARPWLDDRRRLGVRVQRIVLRGANELREVPMDHPDLTKGWWDIERDGQMVSRWTDGDAVVPLPKMDGHVMLEVHLAGEMIYAVDAEAPDTERAAA
jgi:hypothetical protein